MSTCEPYASTRRPLPLVPGIVYGPIRSRRLGLSLGINLLPADLKVCSFDCIYCHCGPTDLKVTSVPADSDAAEAFPSVHAVVRAVEKALLDYPDLDSLTFSGNGEPTLHPYFSQVAFAVHRLRDTLFARREGAKRPRISLFSNASRLSEPEVRGALRYIDMPILKLDAGEPALFEQINRPAEGITLEGICLALREVPDLVVQSVFVDGDISNVTDTAFSYWLERLTEIRPAAVQIYSTDYPVPIPSLRRVSPGVLRRLAERAEAYLSVPVKPYWVA
ncbi:MAG: hypothetical protein JXC32_20105 [Anaerolineae bacterium]|nr:hypothetical protein [Anaerolineae bacterium]